MKLDLRPYLGGGILGAVSDETNTDDLKYCWVSGSSISKLLITLDFVLSRDSTLYLTCVEARIGSAGCNRTNTRNMEYCCPSINIWQRYKQKPMEETYVFD